MVALALAATTLGHATVGAGDVLASAWSHLRGQGAALDAVHEAIVWQGRAPRVAAALAVGAGLALAGAVMQGLTHNPLADPYLLGVSSGASVGAVAVLTLGLVGAAARWQLPTAAFLGALAAIGLTIALAGRGASPVRLILSGVAVGYLASAVVSLLLFSSDQSNAYREILSWLLGSLAGATWRDAAIAGAATLTVGLVVFARSRTLDALLLGDTAAVTLGVDVRRERPALMAAVAVLTGALVSVSGAIGFVGLVVPHAARVLVGALHRRLLPAVALAGGGFLLLADTVARTAFNPVEVPVGIVTALLGAPAFVVLLRRVR